MSEFRNLSNKLMEELQLIQNYEQGPLGIAMAHNLNQIKRFAGYSIPQFQGVVGVSGNTEDDSAHFTEDIGSGYVEFGSVYGPQDHVTLMVGNPIEISDEEYSTLSEDQQAEVRLTYRGTAVVGNELPEEVARMFSGINSFINAEKIRDDSNEPGGDKEGIRLYKGSLDGTDIYTQEQWLTISQNGKEVTVRSLSALGNESGAIAQDSLSMHDFDRIEQAGGSRSGIIGDVTRRTMDSYIENIKEINGINK